MRKLILLILLILPALSSNAQGDIWIKPNKGQWYQNIEYKIEIPSGNLYLEKDGFTYSFTNLNELHDHENSNFNLKTAVVKTQFLNSNLNPTFKELGRSNHYENYFIGNDSNKWVSNLYLYNEVNYLGLYQGISLNIYERNSTLKYDLIIEANADPSQFKVEYTGQNKIEIINNELVISTSLATIKEKRPYAYQFMNGEKKDVNCEFVLEGSIMSFNFPNGYDTSYALTIDPELIFSSFTGSTADNWGMTACPDTSGNLISAGVVFGVGYPIQNAFDSTINSSGNSKVDIALTKFNSNGTSLEYSTYIGGSGSETPHSLVVNNQNELYILGATSSSNFPVSGIAYQSNTNSGIILNSVDGINFSEGVDIFIFKLSANGSSMLASTYLGGTDTDGISYGNNYIAYNYGDYLRGEIIVDSNSDVYISSTTNSTDFPIIGGFNNTLSGTQDAIIAKLNPNLSSLLFSTYVGGSGLESGNSIELSSIGDIYMTGGTTSIDFSNTTGQVNPNYMGGITDGYVIKLIAPNYNSPVATYLGTDAYDQAYFVRLDPSDNVYIYGQSEGSYPASAAQYSNANSGQFIHKMDGNLTSTEWSSVFGAGTGHVEISPTAFSVGDCYQIYVAGWGGLTNSNNASANYSSTNGFPVTDNAYQSVTSGNNFYLATFSSNMLALDYATFFGSSASFDHVDGGTSKFNKSGTLYHAVCASCGGNSNGFPSTPGAFSETNNSTNCNMAGFVFELSNNTTIINLTTCDPNQVGITTQTYTNMFGCDSIIKTITSTLAASVTQNSNILTANPIGVSYQWLDCDNNFAIINGEVNQSYNVNSNGNYAVNISTDNCSDTSGCFSYNSASLNQNFSDNIHIYPNPSNGEIHVDLNKKHETINIDVFDLLGQKISSQNIRNSQHIDLILNLKKGAYIMLLTLDSSEKLAYKILIN
jgi:hypothetical protein